MFIDWIIANWGNIIEVVSYAIAAATIIVKLTPTLKDDAWLKNVIKFISKYVALNHTITKEQQKLANKDK